MKKRVVMALMALSMTMGACTKQEAPTQTPTQAQTETPTATPVSGEEPTPFVSSGNAQNLTEQIGTISAPDAEITDAQKEALSKASLQLFAKAVAGEGEHPNVLLSPTSIQLAFGMTENGANGETLEQMEQVIGGGVSIDEMNPLLCSLSDRFRSAQDVKWNVANSIWFKDDGACSVKDEFAQKALSWYGADIWKAPFDDTTIADINGWVNSETKGMIPEILNKIPPNARMYLINAIAFEGEWMNEYKDSDIREGCSFTNADGSKTDVTMLYSTEERYFTLGNGTGFLRNYKGGEYSFMGLLPEEGTDLDAYIAELAEEDADLAAAIRESEYGTVIVRIPEFTDDYDIEMSDMLTGMGMDIAFDPLRADFSNMLETKDGEDFPVCINRVLHKTHIEVDREGTRAAAVTAIGVADAACEPVVDPVCIYLERPFLYGIIDNETGLPVFLGCVNSL